ncbi:stringent starvation protein A [Gilliamella sp. Choc4-2]|jgi:stringent starvation protein A|uniref:glutathione S-transferase N-terminal domain-containing protein n=1 Tax=unclassified Gilliamella TaxID=2685620 RepID=UPI0004DCD9A2|nr:glutathione S-transferase N-terminal domain-containing protein [Gilliamella apicola]KFA59333.1 Stringent starvation protein A [Gilliamella apicola]OCG32619.1 stringent starvation protein A [Gilliamella apicola]OCG46387.1 stringent starvation protein A [Gilliamella apicola]OCG53739.1 stringent starvation protein A [Gilliamella apicola]
MVVAVNKRSVMTLFCDTTDIYGHQIRFVLAEKGVTAEIEFVKAGNLPQELLDLNPYATIPTLIDRDLTLYESHIALEYLDERFPHPPLMPVYPIVRANSRLTMYRMKREWYRAYQTILADPDSDVAKIARKNLLDDLVAISVIFKEKDYFMSDDFTLCDCYFAPLLWRLPLLEIELPKVAEKNYLSYMARIFERPAFINSLTEDEKKIRL